MVPIWTTQEDQNVIYAQRDIIVWIVTVRILAVKDITVQKVQGQTHKCVRLEHLETLLDLAVKISVLRAQVVISVVRLELLNLMVVVLLDSIVHLDLTQLHLVQVHQIKLDNVG
jgi:hypothetical protein